MGNVKTIVALSLLLLSCSGESGHDPGQRYDHATLDKKYQAVYSLIRDLSCQDSSDCASIGVGSKPCGGPWRYVVYSKATVDEKELMDSVADLNEYEKGYNIQEGISSDCETAPEARPGCVSGKCTDLNSAP